MTENEKLKKLLKGKNTAQKVVLRASIILEYKGNKKKVKHSKTTQYKSSNNRLVDKAL